MSLQAVHLPQPLLIVPPLLPPLVLRTETGFFGAKRFGPGEFDRCRPCTRFEAPASPPPPPPVRYLRRQVHEGVDLEGGSLCVEEGEVVTKGQVIGRIGSGPEDPHLHFALRIVIDPSDSRYWADRSSVALDPTRLLYRLEADDLPVLPAGGAATVSSIGVELVANVPLFRAYTDASPDPYGIPLYEPSTEHERGLAAIFGRALELGRPVEVEYRDSVFFGPHRIPASVRLA